MDRMVRKHFRKYKEKLKHHFHEVMKEQTSSHSIAMSFAIGTFISILPTPGFNILIALLVALTYERVNKLSLFFALAFWNPITLIPMYALSLKIGNILFGPLPVVEYDIAFLDQIFNFSRRFLIGNVILAGFTALVSYFLIKDVTRLYRKK